MLRIVAKENDVDVLNHNQAISYTGVRKKGLHKTKDGPEKVKPVTTNEKFTVWWMIEGICCQA